MNLVKYDQAFALQTILTEKRSEIEAQLLSKSSLRVLNTHLNSYYNWCLQFKVDPFPSTIDTIKDYLIHLSESGKKLATLRSHLWAIGMAHKQLGLSNPCQSHSLTLFLKAIKRQLSANRSAQVLVEKKLALRFEDIEKISFQHSLKGYRDKLIFLLGFVGGFRRGELTGIQIEDISSNSYGLNVFLYQTKSNVSANVSVVRSQNSHFCPVETFSTYLNWLGFDSGSLFYTIRKGDHLSLEPLKGRDINNIVKAYIEQIGLDPALYGAHSLRSGCATHLLEHGYRIELVQKHLRHQSMNTTQEYNQSEVARGLEGVF